MNRARCCVAGESRMFSQCSMPYKVVTSLKETGQYENTIIVVTTDNGGAVKVGGNNLPLRGTKGQCARLAFLNLTSHQLVVCSNSARHGCINHIKQHLQPIVGG